MKSNDYFNRLKINKDNQDKLHKRITRKIKLKSMKKNIIMVTVALIGSALFAHYLSQWIS